MAKSKNKELEKTITEAQTSLSATEKQVSETQRKHQEDLMKASAYAFDEILNHYGDGVHAVCRIEAACFKVGACIDGDLEAQKKELLDRLKRYQLLAQKSIDLRREAIKRGDLYGAGK